MNDRLLSLYHRLPPQTRSIAATARGYYLRGWRYGRETEALVEQALEREHWSPAQWQAWRGERLTQLLHRAATRVPYYREYWKGRRRANDRASWDQLENWPILEKETVRKNAAAFVADDCDIRRMFREHTSGTTGTSLELWWSRQTVRTWYALSEARCRSWYHVSRRDRWAILGGQLVVPEAQRRPPFWVWNAALNQLYMSSYHLAPDLVPYYLDALRKYQIRYIWGYTSALHTLADHMAMTADKPTVTVAITNAEPVSAHQREAIAAGFQCPVRETYGMAEIVTAASECGEGQLHLWPEVGLVEVMEGTRAVTDNGSGDLVCTGLLNTDMPLIRYRVGDRGAIRTSHSACACGRTLPILSCLEGRSDDALYTRDGRRIGRLDPVFKDDLPIREAQIVQESLDRVRISYVPATGHTVAANRSIADRLRARMGDIEVILEEVDYVPRGANGKFRAVICLVPPDQRP